MDSTELGELVRGIRAQLVRRAQLGGWALPGGPSPRPTRDPDLTDEAAGVLARGSIVPLEAPDHAARDERRTLATIRAEVGDCQRCKLAQTRDHLVFGVGPEDAPLVFVGEAPGEREDRTGQPFVGPAGELLDKMIDAMGWSRQHVYITNTLMCRPPNNRDPEPDELSSCLPFLNAKLEVIAPRLVVALGRPAAQNLLQTDASLSSLRGKFHDLPRLGARVMPTFHPAYLLREPDRKRDAWGDLKLVIAELSRLGIHSPNPPRGA